MGVAGEDRAWVRNPWPAWLAFLWGVLFGGLNLLWSAGWHIGVDKLGQAIQDDVAAGDQTIMALNTLGGIGKIVLGILALGTIKTWGRSIHQKLLLWVLYLAGFGMLAYGLANWVQEMLALIGVIDVPRSIGEDAIRWYAWMWEPIWMLGGILMILTARTFQRRPSN